MAKNTIITPIKDQVMADNSTLSSNEIKKRIDTAAASVLPEVSGSDEGKVLTVGSDGSWEAAPVPAPPGKEILIIEVTETAIDADNLAKINVFFADQDKYFAYIKVTEGTLSAAYPYFAPAAIGAGASQYYIPVTGWTMVPSGNDYYAIFINAQSFGTSGTIVMTSKKLT